MPQLPPAANSPATVQILQLFRRFGGSDYGGEAVTQAEHALQSAWCAEQHGATSTLIAAALLHDLGHLLHDLPSDAPQQGVNDLHETRGAAWLQQHFSPEVVEPVRLHVEAKRYLCAVDHGYLARLSTPSKTSLALQGGPMSAEEVGQFELVPFAREAALLRQWDDRAKVPNAQTPDLMYFAKHLDAVAWPGPRAEA